MKIAQWKKVHTALLFSPLIITLFMTGCGGGSDSRNNPNNPDAGNTNGSGTDDSGGVETAERPPAPELMLDIQATKTLQFSWDTVEGATSYQLLENPDGQSGFSEIASLPETENEYPHIVFLPQRLNASYILEACNSAGCEPSFSVAVTGHLSDAVGYFKASNTEEGDSFGSNVALSADGSTLAVGSSGEESTSAEINGAQDDNDGINRGAVYVFVRSATEAGGQWQQQAYIKPTQSANHRYFGNAITLSENGNTLAVGGQNWDGVSVFSRAGSDWTEKNVLKPDSGFSGIKAFGYSLALSLDGDTLAIGARREGQPFGEGSLYGRGAAYVFTRDESGWREQAFLKPLNDPQIDNDLAYVGEAVSLSGDGNVLVVGAPGYNLPVSGVQATLNRAGAAYTFVRNDDGSWSSPQRLIAPNADAKDEFGGSVALAADGLTLAVGAAREQSNATGVDGDQDNNSYDGSGAVYIFTRIESEDTWSLQSYLKADMTDFASFGSSVALNDDGSVLAVGAKEKSSGGAGINNPSSESAGRSGAAYLFTSESGVWQQTAFIKASNPGNSDYFGQRISLSGDGSTLAVAARGESSQATGINGDQEDDSASNAGAVYLY